MWGPAGGCRGWGDDKKQGIEKCEGVLVGHFRMVGRRGNGKRAHPIYTCCPQVLEDIALTIQNQLQAKLPFCAFNGGNDVFGGWPRLA